MRFLQFGLLALISLPEACAPGGHMPYGFEGDAATVSDVSTLDVGGVDTRDETPAPPECLAPLVVCGGDCVDPRSNAQHCGACGATCESNHAAMGCVSGRCAVSVCDDGFGDCDGSPANGCEQPLDVTAHCGTCGRACGGSTPQCVRAAAGLQCGSRCPAGSTPCADGCRDLANDPRNCGFCGALCPTDADPGIRVTCEGGACQRRPDDGYLICRGHAVRPSADACGTRCDLCTSELGAQAVCRDATCELEPLEGWVRCGGRFVRETTAACGAACERCRDAPRNGSVSCPHGACQVTCDTGFLLRGNACVDPTSDVSACGLSAENLIDCRLLPGADSASATCRGGRCVITCAAFARDCDANAQNGCETAAVSAGDCLGCGNACAVGLRCVAEGGRNSCVSSCRPGQSYCEATGMCALLESDPLNCGACGDACPAGATCVEGRCRARCLGDATADCNLRADDGCEVDLAADGEHCGVCGHACRAGETCEAGRCALRCASGLAACGGRCTDPSSDPGNCGACGLTCATRANANAACRSGGCGYSCFNGYADCDGNPENGCETNVDANVESCGGCRVACTSPMGTPRCSGGRCTLAACAYGFGDCDGATANGCETDLNSDLQSCGACRRRCADPQGGTASCERGVCVATCPVGTQLCRGACVRSGPCSSGVGACSRAGSWTCNPLSGAPYCDAVAGPPRAEVCNGADDDCNTVPDDGLTRTCYSGGASTLNRGICRGGTQTCTGGRTSACIGEVTPRAEGIGSNSDDNCDGVVTRAAYTPPRMFSVPVAGDHELDGNETLSVAGAWSLTSPTSATLRIDVTWQENGGDRTRGAAWMTLRWDFAQRIVALPPGFSLSVRGTSTDPFDLRAAAIARGSFSDPGGLLVSASGLADTGNGGDTNGQVWAQIALGPITFRVTP